MMTGKFTIFNSFGLGMGNKWKLSKTKKIQKNKVNEKLQLGMNK
jgi:hypothetical protein